MLDSILKNRHMMIERESFYVCKLRSHQPIQFLNKLVKDIEYLHLNLCFWPIVISREKEGFKIRLKFTIAYTNINSSYLLYAYCDANNALFHYLLYIYE